MKTHVEPYKELQKEIDDAIAFAQKDGLPLTSIELTPEEWTLFVRARTTCADGSRLDDIEFSAGTAMYMGVKVYKTLKGQRG